MKLFELLNDVEVIESSGSLEMKIDYIANDHRKIKKNTVFIAIKGTKRDGNDYITEAIKNGARAIVTDDIMQKNEEITIIIVKNAREALSMMWSNFYGKPSKNIKTIAITGTNGKTSSACFLYNILRYAGISCALVSTIGCFINEEKIEINGGSSVSDVASAMTTPDPEMLYYLYYIMKEKNVEIAVIEASSHALAQKRLIDIDIEIGAFTNLSREHLDFHGSIEEYFLAKEELFKICKMGTVNVDDEYGERIKINHKNTYGFSTIKESEFNGKKIKLSKKGCKFSVINGRKSVKVKSRILGEFTVYNVLLAVSCAMVLGIHKKAIIGGIKATRSVCGRVEKYRDKNIYIDYAHTPEAMKNVIQSVKQINRKKRIIVLFGCGGDRDRGKRAKMGEICSKYADYTVITSDNPRNEEPRKIIEEIISGVDTSKKFIVIEDRREAIERIAKNLTKKDVLLLLGKGHEEYEITMNGKQRFSEREVLDRVFLIDK